MSMQQCCDSSPLLLWKLFFSQSCTWGLWLLWLLCPSILSLSLLIRKNLVDARGCSIYYQLACVTREGHGCCLLLFVCLRNKASFDTDSKQLICSLNTARLGGMCAQCCSSSVFMYVCAWIHVSVCVCMCTCVAKGQWVLAEGSYGDMDWKMLLGGDSQTAGGQRSIFYLCSHLADCFFSSAILNCTLSPPSLSSTERITRIL